jgi:group I intron endonuclease
MIESGIYSITNPIGEVYIGKAKILERRFFNYKYGKGKGQHKLKDSFDKYGFNEHSFTILEKCLVEDLDKRESYYKKEIVNKLGWSKCLFYYINDSKSAGSPPKKVDKYSLNGKFIKTYESIAEAMYDTNCSNIHISCKHPNKQRGGYLWRYHGDTAPTAYIPPSRSKKGEENRIEITKKKLNKKISQINKEGKVIKIYKSLSEAANQLGLSMGNISQAANGKRPLAGGYKWKYF